MATILKFRKMHEVIKKYRTNEKIKLSKYNNIYEDIENSTIPFFMIPNIIIISSKEQKYNKSNEYENIYFLD